MKVRCLKCRKKIDRGNTYCEVCSKVNSKENKSKPKNERMEKAIKSHQWQKVREQVLIRDKGCCQLCLVRGFIENRKLSVHHFYKRVDHEELVYVLDNLITVCPPCHNELENLSVKRQLELLKRKELELDLDYTLL